jgi:hypothetical protein
MRKIIILSLLMITTVSIAQKETYTDKSALFVINQKYYISKKLVDSLNKSRTITLKSVTGEEDDVSIDLPKTASGSESIKYFIVNPDEFIEFAISDRLNPKFSNVGLSNTIKISRDSLKISVFNIFSFKISDYNYKERYKDFSNFKLKKINRNIKKEFCGFECYKVILESDNKILEMFVTENILLNYHPVLNDINILKKYFPLYLKFIDKRFPKDKYSEYTFYLDSRY